MSLQISEKNEMFYLNGKINLNTTSFLISYFSLVEKETIVINIDEVKQIDKIGLNAILLLLKNAKNNNKLFSIVGYGCKEIYDYFDQIKVA